MSELVVDSGPGRISSYSNIVISREFDAIYSSDGDLCQDFFLKRKDQAIIQKNPPNRIDSRAPLFSEAEGCSEISSALWIKWLNFDHFGHLLTETVSSVWPLLSVEAVPADQNTMILIPSRQAARGIAKLKTMFPERQHQILSVEELCSPLIKCDKLMLAHQSMINKMFVDKSHFTHVRQFLNRYMRYQLKLDLSSNLGALPESYQQYIRVKNLNDRKNLYLSRSLLPEQKRLFDQEQHIENDLLNRGWCVVYLEKLPLNIQLQLLSEAETIAGARGSAFHLLMAIEPECLIGKKIIFLNKANKPRKKIKDTFEVQFDAQDLNYLNLRCLVRYSEESRNYPRMKLINTLSAQDLVARIDGAKS